MGRLLACGPVILKVDSGPGRMETSSESILQRTTYCFVIFAEVGVTIFLIELPNGKHVLFNATLDHKDLTLLRNFRHAHVHYAV